MTAPKDYDPADRERLHERLSVVAAVTGLGPPPSAARLPRFDGEFFRKLAEDRELAILYAVQAALAEVGFVLSAPRPGENVPALVEGACQLALNGFFWGRWSMAAEHVLPGIEVVDGVRDDRLADQERNALVLRVLNDETHPRHAELVAMADSLKNEEDAP